MNKFPKIIDKKWKRYNKIEKFFLIFLFILLIAEIFIPFVSIDWIKYSFINSAFLLSSVILLFTLVFIIVWNSSYTFKWFIKSVFGFEQNDAILNFWVLFLHASILIHTKDMISVIWLNQSFNIYNLNYGFYILWALIVFGLIWNLFLAVNLSATLSNKRKSNYSKIVWANIQEKEEKKEVKTLF